MTKLINRRQAVKSTLGLGAAMLTMPHLYCDPLPTDRKLGVALVGLGRYSTLQLGPALRQTKYCKLAGIVTGTTEKATKWAKDYDIPKKNIYNYDNFESIKDNPDIDIVYVVLPNFMHAEYTIKAAEAGKHVICEKPMGISVGECEQMIAACKKANRKLGMGYRLYYEPHHLKAIALSNDKTYGDYIFIEAGLGFSMADPKLWRLQKAESGWGALGDLGLYAIQGCRRILKELPTKVTGQGYILRPDIFKDTYEVVTWQMQFPSGTVANCTTSYSAYVDRLYASGHNNQWLQLKPSFNAAGTALETSDNDSWDISSLPYQQIAQMDDFAYCILNNKHHEASGEEGLIDIKIIEGIMESIENERAVSLQW